ncbi:ABC transporter permease [Mycobacterium sp. GA-2829]|uniref:ABC transporter permease n=1 Tax=Mycobacterium sp. GA-2829 TaxID=1772283 RepID=UPI0007402D86|nr:ABC transporter permease [Mycobacterium sp. GA-2829]KUI36622.1 ABC transporter permease [Mycobacterium sp. GA-2829]
MPWLRSRWLYFRRVHLTALAADWQRTLLSVIGVAIGVTVVLGTLILKAELARPFDAYGPALAHAADANVIEVRPNVSGRLPTQTVDRLRAEVGGAASVIPVVAGLTPVDTHPTRTGFLVLGGSCQIESLVGPFDCQRRARDDEPAHGPGVPLQMPAVVAERHGLRPGNEVRIPGLPAGSAHVGWTFAEFDRVKDINDGYVLLAPSVDFAAWLLSSPGYVTAAFVLPQQGAKITADVDRVISGVATAGPPRPHLPAMFENSTQSSNLIALCGIIIGTLIAVNALLLAVEERRAVLGTIGAIGARPAGTLGGMLCEGALVGAMGGLCGVPTGFLLGTYLVDRFGQAMLAGSGGNITTHFSWVLVPVGAAAGTACGVLAMAGPAVNLVRAGPLASMASAGGVQRIRTIPTWPLVLGTALVACSVIVLRIFRRGSLPLQVGINGMTIGLCGLVLATVWLAPRVARVSVGLLTTVRPSVGRLLGADIHRYALLFAFSTALLAEGTSFAIGSHSMQLLGADQVAAQKAERLPTALLITAQSVLDQRDGRLSDAAFEMVSNTAGGRSVASRRQATISSGALSRQVIGVTPGDWYSSALYEPTDAPDRFWQSLRGGEVGLSEIAAGRLGAAEGDVVSLPTVDGPKRYLVAGVFRPLMVNDAAVGDIVLVDEGLAREDWAAARDQVAVDYPSAADATAHRDDFLDLDAGLRVYDNQGWRVAATEGINRFLAPFTVAGYVVMAAAGLSLMNVFVLGLLQRGRERAVLRAIGITAGQEQAVIVANACLLGLIAVVVAVFGGVGLTYLWSLGSPVYYGIEIEWGLLREPVQTSAAALFLLVFAAAIYPVLHSRRLETVEILRSA